MATATRADSASAAPAPAMATASASTNARPSIGILSIGDMGMGFGKLLRAHDYPVYTVAAGRSQHTRDRIKAAKIKDFESDEELVIECDIILSIVPPQDAVAVARRVHSACKNAVRERQERKGFASLLFMDLNAISSRTAKTISQFFTPEQSPAPPSLSRRISRTLSIRSNDEPPPIPITVRFVDGGIIGPPPLLKPDKSWRKPSVVISGEPDSNLSENTKTVLNMKLISKQIGSASTLKACFASINKGLVALAVASYTTAYTAGVLPELESHLADHFPSIKEFIDRGLPMVPPKAYRWVNEMKQIGETFADEGHLGDGHGGQIMFDGVSDIYKTITEDTVLGKELTHKRKRGTTVEDVTLAIRDGLQEKRKKGEKDPKLELAWKSSWGV